MIFDILWILIFDLLQGAGHAVPIDQPVRAFQIINNFLFSIESPIDYSKKIRRRKFSHENKN